MPNPLNIGHRGNQLKTKELKGKLIFGGTGTSAQ